MEEFAQRKGFLKRDIRPETVTVASGRRKACGTGQNGRVHEQLTSVARAPTLMLPNAMAYTMADML